MLKAIDTYTVDDDLEMVNFVSLILMLSAYFDTNVYDHIDRGWISSDEAEALRSALAGGELVAHLSLADIEELLGQWETDRDVAIRKLRIARDLIGFDEILDQPCELLANAIRAYAAGQPPPSPVLPLNQRGIVAKHLHRVAEGDTRLDSVVSNIVEQIRLMKERFRTAMEKARNEVHTGLNWEARSLAERRSISFDQFWSSEAEAYAEAAVAPLALLNECRLRGLAGLLDVRPVRLCVGVLVSYVYAQVVGDGVQTQQPKLGDAYDLWHAILASTGDVFLTRDSRLAGLLRRIPVENFRVVLSIPELLAVLTNLTDFERASQTKAKFER